MEMANNNIGFICASEARKKSQQKQGELRQQAIKRIENERKDLISAFYGQIATAIEQAKFEVVLYCQTDIEFEELKLYFESKGFNIEVKYNNIPPKYQLKITW